MNYHNKRITKDRMVKVARYIYQRQADIVSRRKNKKTDGNATRKDELRN